MIIVPLFIAERVSESLKALYGQDIEAAGIPVETTNPQHNGDYTLVVFPFLKFSKQSPEQTAIQIAEHMIANNECFSSFDVVKGFLNLSMSGEFFRKNLGDVLQAKRYGVFKPEKPEISVVEYSSPNTNKPLHLGHIRNNLLGDAICRILKASGKKVIRTNLVNDRGIHICKTMLAYQKWSGGKTPESENMKGDHFVGSYYVLFEQQLAKEVTQLVAQGMSEEKARENSTLMQQTRAMLLKWEERDAETIRLWRTMNNWVYDGFEQTYAMLGISFDKVYYESETWLNGKRIVQDGLKNGVFFQKEDGSVWVNLVDEGLDEKILLRSDGTSVYITQDLGSAEVRMNEFKPDQMIYVVGSEQDYHFEVLKKTLVKAGKAWANNIYHLSYGMVELPDGKMKSREGKVVDADDLILEMIETAESITRELGKTQDIPERDAKELYATIGLGALKYYLLKVDPRKKILFDPKESIDFNGNTGPFIQYTYARIQSIIRKAKREQIEWNSIPTVEPNETEKIMIVRILSYPENIAQAAKALDPGLIANYVYDLAKLYNRYYHEHRILNAESEDLIVFRLALSDALAGVIRSGMELLGINVPMKM